MWLPVFVIDAVAVTVAVTVTVSLYNIFFPE